jgi:glycosyltransferase 2 family protein
VLAQRFGLFRLLEHVARGLAAARGAAGPGQTVAVHAAIHAIYARPRRITVALALHVAAWLIGIAEAGVALAFMGVSLGLGSLLVLESLIYAVRGAAFFVPAAAGVQEGGYIVLGGFLGIGPDFALALSLMKRAREVILGGIGILLWQLAEGRHQFRKESLRSASSR